MLVSGEVSCFSKIQGNRVQLGQISKGVNVIYSFFFYLNEGNQQISKFLNSNIEKKNKIVCTFKLEKVKIKGLNKKYYLFIYLHHIIELP